MSSRKTLSPTERDRQSEVKAKGKGGGSLGPTEASHPPKVGEPASGSLGSGQGSGGGWPGGWEYGREVAKVDTAVRGAGPWGVQRRGSGPATGLPACWWAAAEPPRVGRCICLSTRPCALFCVSPSPSSVLPGRRRLSPSVCHALPHLLCPPLQPPGPQPCILLHPPGVSLPPSPACPQSTPTARQSATARCTCGRRTPSPARRPSPCTTWS